MPRVVLFLLLIGLLGVAAYQVTKYARDRTIDWRGVAVMIGFVAVALYMRHTFGLPHLL